MITREEIDLELIDAKHPQGTANYRNACVHVSNLVRIVEHLLTENDLLKVEAKLDKLEIAESHADIREYVYKAKRDRARIHDLEQQRDLVDADARESR